jgi:hypothetical protein
MLKRVSAEQIGQLYTFTRQHFVEHYDLQTELVDHLANAIETLWESRPQLTFDEALQTEFRKFGIYGFSDVVEERQKALNKRYSKLIFRYFKEFFRLPQIIITLVALIMAYNVFAWKPILYIPIILMLQVFSFYKIMRQKKIYKQKIEASGRRWLFEEMIYRSGTLLGFAGITIQSMQFALKDQPDSYYTYLMAAVFVVSVIHSYVVLYSIPSKAQEHLSAVYPGYVWEKL